MEQVHAQYIWLLPPTSARRPPPQTITPYSLDVQRQKVKSRSPDDYYYY